MPEIPNLTSQITRPIDGDVTGLTPDSERCIWRAQSSEVDVRLVQVYLHVHAKLLTCYMRVIQVRVKKLFKSRSDWRNSLQNTVSDVQAPRRARRSTSCWHLQLNVCQAVARELVQWHKIRHSNVVSVFGFLHRDLTPFLVTPWIAGGNLNIFLTQHDQFLSPVDCISLVSRLGDHDSDSIVTYPHAD
jgi:hypothetical protein